VRAFISFGIIVLILLQAGIKTGLVGYYQFNKSYIAAALCVNKSTTTCQGKCYLTKKLAEEASNENKLAGLLKTLKDVTFYCQTTIQDSLLGLGFPTHSFVVHYFFNSPTPPVLGILHPPC